MKTVAEVLAETTPAERVAQLARLESPFAEPRLYRAHLCYHIFGIVDVTAAHPVFVARLAESRASEAVRDFSTAPHCFRIEAQRRKNPRDPLSPLIWVPVEHAPINPFDPGSGCAWQFVSR